MDQTAQTNQPRQQQRPPGTESALTPQADHGEHELPRLRPPGR